VGKKRSGYNSWYYKTHKAQIKVQQNSASGKATRRKHQLKKHYGLTPAQHAALVSLQRGACAVCHIEMSKPHVDHDHETDAVRGILCSNCNTAIGLLHDSPSTARALANYLESDHNDVRVVKEFV
jgi:Recombination endonuclease VII